VAQTRDLYEVLGVSRDATPEDIKKAYRRLAREFHPDVSADPEAEHKIKEINLAYQTLSDPRKRQQYDMYGGRGFTQDMFNVGDISDIFEMFFGGSPFGGRRSRGPRVARGADGHAALGLTFEEAAFGARKEIEIDRLTLCDACAGTGAAPGSAPVGCRHCGGTGEVSDVRRSVFGTVMTSRTCSVCGGSGQEIADPCPTCRGDGRVPETRSVSVEVPAGVADGMDLRVEGVGEQGHRGAPPGDLYLTLRVEPHPVFERRGQDLVAILDVPLTQAVLGADLAIETLDGPETVKIPPGLDPGTVIRLPGRGVPNIGRRGRGDLYLECAVDIPSSPSRKERALIEQLAELRSETTGKGAGPGTLRKPR